MTSSKSSCHDCHKPVGDEAAVFAGRHLFHLRHFRCHLCHQTLAADDAFHVSEAEVVVCIPCFSTKLAPKCAKCNEGIVQNGVTASERVWHATCLTCTRCGKLLFGRLLFDSAGNPVDYDCYWGHKLQEHVAAKSTSFS